MKSLLMAAIFTFVAISTSVWAQDAASHEAHHPAQAETPAQPATPTGQSGMGGMGMMNMMGGGASMMEMMRMMGMAGSGMDGMATIDRVEGRIAFLRAELKITEGQTGAWNAFAEALRANAKKLGEVRGSMMAQMNPAQQQAPTMAARLGLQEQWLAARLEGTRAMRSTVTTLYGVLSDEQKKTANEILAPHMGMMAMMAGQMQPGQMMPGQMMRQQPAQPGK